MYQKVLSAGGREARGGPGPKNSFPAKGAEGKKDNGERPTTQEHSHGEPEDQLVVFVGKLLHVIECLQGRRREENKGRNPLFEPLRVEGRNEDPTGDDRKQCKDPQGHGHGPRGLMSMLKG